MILKRLYVRPTNSSSISTSPNIRFSQKHSRECGDVVRQTVGLSVELQIADCKLLRKQSSRVSTVVPHKILRKNYDPEYYNKEVKRLKANVRRKLGERYQAELKNVSREWLPEKKKKTVQEHFFLRSVLRNEVGEKAERKLFLR